MSESGERPARGGRDDDGASEQASGGSSAARPPEDPASDDQPAISPALESEGGGENRRGERRDGVETAP